MQWRQTRNRASGPHQGADARGRWAS